MQKVKKVVVIGPESTGKSTLCKKLAKHYNTLWCPEYAREYLLSYGRDYTYADLLQIAKGQIELEDEYIEKVKFIGKKQNDNAFAKPKLLLVDTDMYVMKVWCEFVFNNCHPFIQQKIAQRRADLYLLCNIDLAWVKDELREYPDLETREQLYNIYLKLLNNQAVPWVDISGDYNQRTRTAINAIDNYFFPALGV